MLRGQYTFLPQDEEEKNLPEGVEPERGLTRLIRWSLIIIATCSALDVVALLYLASGNAFQRPVALDDLPVQSTYIHLEDLYLKNNHQSSSHKPIINLPKSLLLINSSDPDIAYPQWPKSWTTAHGVVPINDRRLLVSPTVSSVAQFRVMDFGMEKCALTLTIPYNNDTSASVNSWERRDTVGESKIHVWTLKEDRRLDHHQITWKTKPKRDRHLGSFSVSQGSTQELRSFPCTSGTYITFELACTTKDCYFDLTATAKNAIGVYMKQYQTV